jgi:hypothetical protein
MCGKWPDPCRVCRVDHPLNQGQGSLKSDTLDAEAVGVKGQRTRSLVIFEVSDQPLLGDL